MDRRIRTAPARGRSKPQALAIALFDKTKPLPPGYRALDEQLGGLISTAIQRAEFSAAKGALTTLYPPLSAATQLQRVFVMGLGTKDRFTAQCLRIAAAKLASSADAAGVDRLRIEVMAQLDDHLDADTAGRALAEGLAIGNFRFTTYQGAASKPSAKATGKPKDLIIDPEPPLRTGLNRGLIVGESVNLTRSLAATPPNHANPAYLSTYCRRMARQVGLTCSVIDAKRAAALNMGGLLAVGAAGSTPPALICLEHRPPSRRPKSRSTSRRQSPGPILLVGKAVTFDTGGYSIKPAAGMESMKYDKCGGMAVIGAMHAIAKLGLPAHVVGLIPTAENMVDRQAYRPSDILTLINGVTVEVTNTDAEGRLVLADALAYGHQRYQPRAVIDLATLTGGVVVALGGYCAGMFCNDPQLSDHLQHTGEGTGERLWPLPLWTEHREQLKGTHGDIVNSGGRGAHACQGAAFLSYFVDPSSPTDLPKTPWAHLDIAGVSDNKETAPPYSKGPTGFGVRLLVQAIETWDKRS